MARQHLETSDWRSRLRIAVIVLTLIPGASAFADILVGVAGPMGGQNATFGEQMKTGVSAAIDSVNASGGINGERLVMVAADDACDTRRAVTVAEDFVRQDVRVVIGHFCSGATIATAQIYERAGIVVIAPSASAPAVTEGKNWNVLRLAARDDAQADLAAQRIAAENPNARIAIVSDGQSLGRGLATRLKQRAPSSIEFTIKAGVADQSATIAAMKEAGITAVYFTTAATDAGNITAALRKADVTARIYGPDTLLSEVFWERAKAAGEGAQATFSIDAATLVQPVTLQDQFVAKGIAIDNTVLTSYAAVETFVAAARARDVNAGRSMADWLKSGASIDTVIGPVSFDAKGDVTVQRFTWYRWSDGQFVEDPKQN